MGKFKIKLAKKIDQNFLLSIRNSKQIRKNFFNTKKILRLNHNNWFETTKDNVYIFLLGGKKVGYLRLNNINEEISEVSIAIIPKFQNNGYASKFLSLAIKKMDNKILIAKVKKNNKSSLRFFVKNFFHIYNSNKIISLIRIINKKNDFTKKQNIINKIQKIRSKNNINWMNILKEAFKVSPYATTEFFSNVSSDDKKINELSKKLGNF